MGTSRRCVSKILACHCSQSCCCRFFAVGFIVGVVVVVVANANTAAQGRRGCQLAIVAAILLRLVIAVVLFISTITIAWDDNDELLVVLLRLVQFFMCGGNWQGHTSPHTLVMLEVCRHTFGWGQKLSSKIVVCKYQRLASKKAWQPKLVVFYKYQSFGDKK